MSRRKQAKPRSCKPEFDTDSSDENNTPDDSPNNTSHDDSDIGTPSENQDAAVTYSADDSPELGDIEYSPPAAQNNLLAAADVNDSSEFEEIATDQDTWYSGASDCATPDSVTELPDQELFFTVGVTEATPYACGFCSKAFPRLSFLKKHEQVHSDQMPFRCDFCSRLFKHKRSRDRHVKLHTGDKKYKCLQCNAAFSRSDHLKIHLKTHDTQKPFQCQVCNRGYSTAAALTSHLQKHEQQAMDNTEVNSPDNVDSSNIMEENVETLSCEQCGECFSTIDCLQNHIASAHMMGYSEQNDSDIPVIDITNEAGSELPQLAARLACMYCGRDFFSTMEQLQLHVQVAHGALLNGETCNSSSYTLPPNVSLVAPMPRRQIMPAPSYYQCQICPMQYSSLQKLHRHIFIAHKTFEQNHPSSHSDGSFACIKCGMPFPALHLVAEHYFRVHDVPDDGLFTNPIPDPNECSRQSNEERPPKRLCVENENKINQYEQPGPLLCNQCNASLPNFESFRNHLRSHIDQTKLMPQESNALQLYQPNENQVNSFVCAHCNRTLSDFQALEQHTADHFLISNYEYECKFCNRTFLSFEELQSHHMELHSQYIFKCEICKDVFHSKVEIQMHFHVKHKSTCKVYRCSACPIGSLYFYTKMDFLMHVRNTHGLPHLPPPQRSVKCPFCKECFNTEIEMQFHLASHSRHFHCQICPEKFQIEFLLDRHMEACHSMNQQPAEERNGFPDDQSNRSKASSSTSSLHSPNTPPRVIQSRNPSEAEQLEYPELNMEPDIIQTPPSTQIRPNSKQANVSLHCAYCGEACKSRMEIENHLKHHSQASGGPGKYKCNICDEICQSAMELAKHKLNHCKIVAGNNCTHCKATISHQEQFYMHLIEHSNNNNSVQNRNSKPQLALPTPCVICRQTLISDIEVKLHSQFHLNSTIQREYECSVCSNNVDNNNVIISNHGSNSPFLVCKDCYTSSTGNQPEHQFRCNECNLTCSSNTVLQDHISTVHTKIYTCVKCNNNYQNTNDIEIYSANNACHLCQKLYPTRTSLQAHLIEHTFAGCPSYTCYICSAVFTSVQGLQNHMPEHGAQTKPYDCSKCDSKFYYRAELDNHNFTHLEMDSLLEDDNLSESDLKECSPNMYICMNCKSSNERPDTSEEETSSSREENDDSVHLNNNEITIKHEQELSPPEIEYISD